MLVFMHPEIRPLRHLHRHGFDPRAGSPPDWLRLVLASTSEAEVTSTTRDYLAAWLPQEIARLPKECWPGRIRDGVDISNLAFVLARAHCFHTGPERDKALLEKMMVFFTHAATRIARIQRGYD
jgi:hypothetical protein